jgi:DHA2 family multidrug resistance protein-like MFS transporter
MDLTVLNLAVPKLSADLNPTSSQLLWIVDIYGFLLAGFLITMGTLGDRIGRRKLLMIGAAAFGIASVLAAWSDSANMLIAARALLGVAGATLAPSTLSLIRNMFHDDKERTTAIAIWITSFSLGGAVGPIVGGTLLEHYWWGSVFLVAIPVMILLLITGPLLLPEYKNPERVKIDFLSAVMSLATVLAVIYGIKAISQDGFTWRALISIALGVGLGFLFIKRQNKLADPFLDLSLFRTPEFSASLGIYMFSTFILFGMFFFIAQYLQLVLSLSPFQAGLWTLPSFAGFIIGSMATPALSAKIRPKNIMTTGLLLAAVGFALLMQLGSGSNLAIVVTALALISLGIAPVFTLATDMVVGSAPPERAGAASSLSETASELGGALGIAILGSIGSFIFIESMEDYSHLAKSVDTLGGAAAMAATIPSDQAAQLLHQSRASFTLGLNWVGGLSAVIAASLGFISFISYRKE